jgi:hypothetical protein
MLEQKTAQVLLAALASFGAAKVGGEVLMKGGKLFRHAFKRRRVHLHPPNHGDVVTPILPQEKRRCNTS